MPQIIPERGGPATSGTVARAGLLSVANFPSPGRNGGVCFGGGATVASVDRQRTLSMTQRVISAVRLSPLMWDKKYRIALLALATYAAMC